jgi:hypothetical protein
MVLDRLIVPVDDRDESVQFLSDVPAFGCEGESGLFTVLRVSPARAPLPRRGE